MQMAYAAFYGVDAVAVSAPGFTVRAMHADPDRIVERHAHDGAHAIAVLSGKYLSLASPDIALRAADIVYNPHGVDHRDTFDGGNGRFLAVSLDPHWYPPLPGEAPIPFVLRRPEALAAMVQIWSHLASKGRADAQAVEAAVLAIAACAAPHAPENTSRCPPLWALNAHDRFRSGNPALSVAAMARSEGMHPVAYARAFRRYFGQSPLRLAQDARLQGAAQDLAQGRSPVAEISLKWGFFDQAHFSRQFRTRFGCAPGQFRNVFQS
jgi:AraC family transcriptional regulator